MDGRTSPVPDGGSGRRPGGLLPQRLSSVAWVPGCFWEVSMTSQEGLGRPQPQAPAGSREHPVACRFPHHLRHPLARTGVWDPKATVRGGHRSLQAASDLVLESTWPGACWVPRGCCTVSILASSSWAGERPVSDALCALC